MLKKKGVSKRTNKSLTIKNKTKIIRNTEIIFLNKIKIIQMNKYKNKNKNEMKTMKIRRRMKKNKIQKNILKEAAFKIT
jgi:hypothetical protein